MKKKSKNNIQWKGTGMAVISPEHNEEVRELQQDVMRLDAEEKEIDQELARVQAQLKGMTDDENYQKKAFVTYNDIRNIASLKDRTIIAVRAPSGTTLTVPDPDDGMEYPNRRFQIFLHSPSTPIKVYLLSNDEQPQHETSTVQQSSITNNIDTTTDISKTSEKQPLQQIQHVETTTTENFQKLSPPPADPDFIYGMETNEGISDLYDEISLSGNNEDHNSGLFDAD